MENNKEEMEAVRQDLKKAIKAIAVLLNKYRVLNKWDAYECALSYVLAANTGRVKVEDNAYTIGKDGLLQPVDDMPTDHLDDRNKAGDNTNTKAEPSFSSAADEVAKLMRQLRLKG